jgi:hypothetical protein
MARIGHEFTAQDSAGNIIPSADVEVRNRSDNSFATIYDAETGGFAITQPGFQTDSNGDYEFWVEPGRYNVTVGSGASAKTYPINLSNVAPVYDTRQDFVDVVSDLDLLDGTIVFADGLQYRASSGATDISDLPGFVPVDPNVKHWGATGDGSTDDTAAFQAAANYGGPIQVTAGTYMLDTVTCSGKVNWSLEPDATVKLRAGADAIKPIFDFTSAAAGSSFDGGTVDGNRDSLKAEYNGYADADNIWCGIRALDVDDFSFSDVTFQNHITMGFWTQGNRVFGRSIRVKDSGKIAQIKKCHHSNFTNVTGSGIGNDGLDVYQHATEIRQSNALTIRDFKLSDFNPDATGREPQPEAFAFELCEDLTVDGLVADGFIGTSSSGKEIGIYFDTCSGTVSGCKSFGFTQGLIANTCEDFLIVAPILDGEFTDRTQGGGLTIKGTGLSDQSQGVLSSNGRSNSPGFNVRVMGGVVRRFYEGASYRGKSSLFDGLTIEGCVSNSVAMLDADTNSFFPAQTPITPSLTMSNCIIKNNGKGIRARDLATMRLQNCEIRGNGQDTSAGNRERSGFYTESGGTRGVLEVRGNFLGDAAYSSTDSISFVPGTTTGDHIWDFTAINPAYFEVGQNLTLTNGSGSGDVTGQIVDIQYDTLQIRFASATTLGETGNLRSLTGTMTNSGNVVTGVGTSFDTEIKGRSVVKINGEYLTVIRAESATEIVLKAAPASDFSGETAEVIEVDATYAAQQTYGIDLSFASDRVLMMDNDLNGNSISEMVYGSYSQFDHRSEIIAENSISLNTGGPLTSNILSNIPIGWASYGVTVEVDTTITGATGNMIVELRDSGGPLQDAGVLSGYAAGSDAITSIPEAAFANLTNFSVRSQTGAPTAGAVTGKIWLRAGLNGAGTYTP